MKTEIISFNTTLNKIHFRFRSYKLHLTASLFNLQIRQTFSFSKVERIAQKIIKNVRFEFNTKINIELECAPIYFNIRINTFCAAYSKPLTKTKPIFLIKVTSYI